MRVRPAGHLIEVSEDRPHAGGTGLGTSTRHIEDGVLLEQDVEIPARDGTRLRANVFRPDDAERRPVVASVTPYGKDLMPNQIGMAFMRISGVRFGRLAHSRWTSFEAPDPLFWTRAGYVVIQADVRGMHSSPGSAGLLTRRDADDYEDVITWAAEQPWSTGDVALCGVSYLAMSQWRVAGRRPPALRAIIPWEGATDLLREFGYQDGIPETRFIKVWWRFRMRRGRHIGGHMVENFPRDRDKHPLDDAYWAAKRPALERIEVPALVGAGWGDHGLHTRGSIVGFERMASERKWLYTHGGRKWETFYSEEAKQHQRRFLDHVVKGEDNGWADQPRVRLETRRTRDDRPVRYVDAWPVPADHRPLYLTADGRLAPAPPAEAGSVTYRGEGHRPGDRASFSYRFEQETELTGGMNLVLWVSTDGDDLDLFAVIRKFDAAGRHVPFFGYNGFADDAVAKGWLRASHRELDPERSRPDRPWHTHAREERLLPGQIVPVEIEILPSSTVFEAGSQLRVDVLGHDADRYPGFRHRRNRNRGRHHIHVGGRYDSRLVVPVVSRPG
ncbi:acyl esterase [Promicromonospora soli]|uniref:Acyl esterase n=1 Tax=Promicromonospora soli TaxID=2035533 RepID=A0A919KUK7_9MICO|nr:acyl esterase [Promicromonospora soli]